MTDWKLVTSIRYCIFREGVKFCEADSEQDAQQILQYVRIENGEKRDIH